VCNVYLAPLDFRPQSFDTPAATGAESLEDSEIHLESPRPESHPPEPEHTTTNTAPDLIRQVNETAGDIEENLRMLEMLVRVDPAEKAKQEAVFSYNLINLIESPVEFKNPFNSRPLNKLRVREMSNALLKEGFRVFSNENRIMVVVHPSDVEPSCITLDSTAPPKKLCLKTGSNLRELVVVGGQHRREALRLINLENNEKIRRLEDSIKSKKKALSQLIKQRPETDEARQRKGELETEIKGYELELSHRKESKKLVGPWGVMLLDPGELYVALLVSWHLP
jgi:hypothetical protein